MSQSTRTISFPVLQQRPLEFGQIAELAGDPSIEVLFWDGSRGRAITGYAEARAVLASPSFSTEVTTPGFPSVVPGISAIGPEQISFLRMDPPRHDQLRRMLIPYFSFRGMERMRPRVREIAQSYLDEMEKHGSPADVTALVAMPIPCKITCEMLGVPYADHDFFQRKAIDIITVESGEAVAAATGELFVYLADLVKAKEAEPGDDLISQLVVEQLRPGTLTRDELVAMTVLVLLSGIETSANMISLGVLSLTERPDLVEVARAGGDGLAQLVEELLRYHTIAANSVWRVAKEDVQIGDLQFEKGQGVVILLDVVNRDATAFPNADELCPRPAGGNTHLAFGHGVHQCLGQSLARVEMQEAIGEFFRRFSDVQLAVPLDEVKYRGGTVIRGISELPVTWKKNS